MIISSLLDDLLHLQSNYESCNRTTITLKRYQSVIGQREPKSQDVSDINLFETLIEHVGHLPIVATFLYPHIQNFGKFDLGKSLTMLAIHDIGETITGDVMTFNKTQKHEDDELEVVERILNPFYKDLFHEYEDRVTLEAKYAKSIDVISPMLWQLVVPSIFNLRLKHYKFTIQDMVDKQRVKMEWDEVILKLFDEIISRMRSF